MKANPKLKRIENQILRLQKQRDKNWLGFFNRIYALKAKRLQVIVAQ